MLHVSTWTRITVSLILLLGLLIALPNALPTSITDKYPSWIPHGRVNLGLDLQGGSYILLEVGTDQVYQEQIESLRGDVRIGLRKAHVLYIFKDTKETVDRAVVVQIKDADKLDEAKSLLAGLNPSMGGSVLSVGGKAYEITTAGNVITMRMSEPYRTQTRQHAVEQSIEVVRKRIDEMGTREPAIERQGDDRIVVQVPGLSHPEELLKILQTTAKMTFQLVDETADPQQVEKGIAPIGSVILQESGEDGQPDRPIAIQKRIMVSGDRLTDAQQSFNQQGQVAVNFRFDTTGARQFGDVTKNNTGKRFAIVLDKKVLSAPVIREPILGGSGEITGSFTVKSANELAVMLRAGALPAPLKPIEQRTIGAELGADQIHAGSLSAIAGLIAVVLFMIARYGLFGLFADVALTFNIVLLLAVLTLFGATLTLPGIAGIVLTMGMAVDANVLIYERIREEQRNGRSMIASIDTGFRRAMATIIDANSTHLIAP
jgi:protein-export membrane protein SecD